MVKPGLLLAALTILGTAACAAPADHAPKVASLAGGTAAPSASATAERARLRLDDTPADFQRKTKPYYDCTLAHGVDARAIKSGAPATKPKSVVDAVVAACQVQWPLPPWEEDPANPRQKDFLRAVGVCLRDDKHIAGVKVLDDGYDEGPNVYKIMDNVDDCKRIAAKKLG